MAIKAPTAPTPPTPPSVPGVTLNEGGTAQETNVPRDRQQTGDEQAEAQARQAVARGDGALSKTTQSQPEKPVKSNKPVDASGGASQENQASSVQVIPAQNGLNEENPRQQALADAKAQTQSQSENQPDGWQQFSSHGAVFWGAVLIVMGVVVWFGIRKLMARREGKHGALSFADIDGAAAPVPLPGKDNKKMQGKTAGKVSRSREQVETFAELRGLTPDEVLSQIAHDEEMALKQEIRQARAEAKERLQKAGRIPVNVSPPPHAARQYREQLTAQLPEKQNKTKPPVKPRSTPQEEEQRFEVRI